MPNPPPPRKYLIQINGRKIFARGSNWLPCDLLYGRPGRAVYEYLIRMATEANHNLFRVWGCGVIDKPEFFDLCDRYGIMLFQEFDGPWLPETDAGLAITARETREILPSLMNHPCIVRYCGGNEWYGNESNKRQMAQLRKICNEVDPTRPYYDPDPQTLSQRHGPHWYAYQTHYQCYNTGEPLTMGPDNPIEWTEYGTSGASSVETLQSIMPAKDLWPIRNDNPYWIWHKAFSALPEYGPEHWLDADQYRLLFGELPDLPTTVRCSQFLQAEGLRYANQSMRRFRWHRSGCASWTFNEPWPNAAHGCTIEYFGRPKMAYYYTKQAFAPVDVLAVYSSLEATVGKPMSVDLWAVNDHLEPLAGYQCRYRVTDLRGKILAEKTIPAEVPSEGNVKIGAVEWTPTAEMTGDVALVWLDLLDAKNLAVAKHLYTFGVSVTDKTKQPLLAPMLKTTKTTLKATALDRKVNAAGETELTLEVQNTGAVPALFVKAEVVRSEAIEVGKLPPRLDWIYFSDNYFSLQAGESRRMRVTMAGHAPKQPAIRIDAWNAGVGELR
ncbi:MAG: glycoside hydrolase family 2 TIM barrel-domain containing protein [bacterium]